MTRQQNIYRISMIRNLRQKHYCGPNVSLIKSYMLATFVEESFIGQGRFSRGVKQRNEKGIWVLQATSMPSILVETGFITYKSDEKYLNSEEGQNEIAENILTAVKKYKLATEGK